MSQMTRIAIDGDAASRPVSAPFPPRKTAKPWSVVAPEMAALIDAIESAVEEKAGFDLPDVERVEAFWQMIDSHSSAHGFVLALRNRTRLYLQRVTARDDDKPIKEIEVLPMGDERYPDLRGGGIVWLDEVGELNRLLKS